MSPSTRSLGRSPATMCRSDASFSIISSSRERRFRDCAPAVMPPSPSRHHHPGGSREGDGGMTAGAQSLNLRSLLEEMIEKDASDLHIAAGGSGEGRVGKEWRIRG